MIFQLPLTSEMGVLLGSNGLEYKVVRRGQNVTFVLQVTGAGAPLSGVRGSPVAGMWSPGTGCRRVVLGYMLQESGCSVPLVGSSYLARSDFSLRVVKRHFHLTLAERL
uniref:Uncharacterized protein n=1 Tax=Cannabis sativa TaxID=3483 RepID=A0A803PBQ2_CANSA